MDNTDITSCFKDCSTMKDVFNVVASNNLTLYITSLIIGQEGFKVLNAKNDYAIIKICEDSFDLSVTEGEFIHPYGSKVGYTTMQQFK
jgi:hypothetical protein